jgi:predicted nucleotidyltransferase
VTGDAPFEEVLERVVGVFERTGIAHALIGALAVAAWGAPRATEDIDLLADAAPSARLDAALGEAGFVPEWRRGDADDPVPLLLRLAGAAGGPDVDVLCVTRAWEREVLGRAVRVRIPGGAAVPVVTAEDLIVLKLLAGGPGDLADVAELLVQTGPLPDLDARAAARGVLDLLRRIRAALA